MPVALFQEDVTQLHYITLHYHAFFDISNHNVILFLSVPVAARSKAQVYGRSYAEIVGSNPTGGTDVCLLSGRGLCDELITRPEESYRM